MENLGDLGAFLIFLVVIGANLLASIAKKIKNDRERRERQSAPPPSSTGRPVSSSPTPELFPRKQVPTETQEGWPQRSAPAPSVPQRRKPRPTPSSRRESPRSYPPRQPAPTEPPVQPTPVEPDWREILGDPFKQLEEMFAPPKPSERKRPPHKRPVPPPSTAAQPAVLPKPLQVSLSQAQPVVPAALTPGSRGYGIPQPGAGLGISALRRAVIWSEILGPPIALRPRRHLPPIHH